MELNIIDGGKSFIRSTKKYAFKNRWEEYSFIYLRKSGTLATRLRGKQDWFVNKQEAQKFLDKWLPKQEKLTQEEVKKASEESELEALDCSIEHWKQNLDVENCTLGEYYCAICVRAERRMTLGDITRCKHCILNNYKKIFGVDCCKEYETFANKQTTENAIAMLNKLVKIRNDKYGNKYTKLEEKKMANKIVFDDGKEVELSKETTERLRKELVKPDEPKLKHGDIVQDEHGFIRIILKCKGNLIGFNEANDWSGAGFDLDAWAKRCGFNLVGNVFKDY